MKNVKKIKNAGQLKKEILTLLNNNLRGESVESSPWYIANQFNEVLSMYVKQELENTNYKLVRVVFNKDDLRSQYVTCYVDVLDENNKEIRTGLFVVNYRKKGTYYCCYNYSNFDVYIDDNFTNKIERQIAANHNYEIKRQQELNITFENVKKIMKTLDIDLIGLDNLFDKYRIYKYKIEDMLAKEGNENE